MTRHLPNLALGCTLLAAIHAAAQTRVSPAELAALRTSPRTSEVTTPVAPARVSDFGEAGLSAAVAPADQRAAVDLYVGLQGAGNGFWSFGEAVYWALDDGRMGPAGAAQGGGRVTQYKFAFGVHADFAGDVIRPYVIVSLYAAPYDPVADATNPVVEPPAPVSSVAWLVDPLSLPAAGSYAVQSPLIDLEAAGYSFDLPESFYVEILALEWSSYPAGNPVLDPDVHALFTGPGTVTVGSNADVLWSDLWVYVDGEFTLGNGNGLYDHPAEMDTGGASPYLNQSGLILRGVPCDTPNALVLSISDPEDLCVRPGEPVTITLSQACLPGLVRGYQAFLEFNPARLTFDSGTYIRPVPYDLPIIDPIAANGPEIDLAAGVNDLGGQLPTSADADLAVLVFAAAGEGLTSVAFRLNDPPTRFSDPFGAPVWPTLVDSPVICVDGTPPEVTCPPDPEPQCLADVPAAAATLAAFVTQGGSASDSGCGSGLTFEYLGETYGGGTGCPASPLVITRTYRVTDCAGNSTTCVQAITVIDDTPPELSGVPGPRIVPADAGGCTAVLVPPITPPAATDNCDPAPLVEYRRSDRTNWNEGLADPYPQGATTITWRARDDCGNEDLATTVITVAAVNELSVTVQLQPYFVTGPVTRCITFELWRCSPPTAVTVSADLTFTSGVASTVLEVPCGLYSCMTARDPLHTLRRTCETFGTVGTQYVADFSGNPADPNTPGDWLISGNLNGDEFIDILDFGVFSNQYVNNPVPGAHTPCGTAGPHADLNGDGQVNTGDFSYIQINFLKGHEARCCGAPGLSGAGPLEQISVVELRQRGLGHLAAGDLNADGWLDARDVAALLAGQRPQPVVPTVSGVRK